MSPLLGNNGILIANIISWAIVTIIFFRRRKKIDSAVFLLLTFLIYSICSYLTFNSEYGDFSGETLSILPLIYLFLMILLTMSPIIRFNIANITHFPCTNFKVLDLISWIFIICMAIKIPIDLTHIQEGLLRIMSAQGASVYSDVLNESRLNSGAYVISSLPSIYVNITVEIVTLLAFYNLYKKRRAKFTTAIFIAIAITPLGSIASGQRSGTFDVIIIVLGTYFLFSPILEKKVRKFATKVGVIFLVCIMIPIIALTLSRYGTRGGDAAIQSVYSYMGQQNIYFDLYAFDNNGLRYGDRVFPLLKKMVGFDNVPDDFWERREKYHNLKINDEVFIGYIGDFLLDFGPLISTLMFLIFSSVFLKITSVKGQKCYFHQLLALHFILTLGLQGGLRLFPFADEYGLKIIAYALLYIYIRINKRQPISGSANILVNF